MAVVSIEIPDEMIEFAMPSNKDEQLRINAMILYSHRKAKENLQI